MVRLLLLAVLSISVVLGASAQLNGQAISSPAHNHAGAASTQLIDGSVNPEKIPDVTAYRLFFLVFGKTPNARPEDQAKELNRQQGILNKIGLSAEERLLLISILDDFRVQYAALTQQYNASAEALAAKGQVANSKAFVVQRDNLVQATRDKLQALTPEGANQLDQHVQREKRGMKSVVPVSQ